VGGGARWRVESGSKREQSGGVGVEEAKRESSTRPRADFKGVQGGGRRRARWREQGVEVVAVAMVCTSGARSELHGSYTGVDMWAPLIQLFSRCSKTT
jgi:hypothetical protein